MMNLAEYRRTSTRLADFLPWAALAGEGVVLNKDGSFQRTARFRGPDLDSAVPAELVAVAGRLNSAFRRLGSGWALFVEAQRHAALALEARGRHGRRLVVGLEGLAGRRLRADLQLQRPAVERREHDRLLRRGLHLTQARGAPSSQGATSRR